MTLSLPPARFLLVCFAALAVAFPIAIISLAKILLFVCVLAVLARHWLQRGPPLRSLSGATVPAVLLAVAAMSVSSLWSAGAADEALTAIVKHGKLMLIPLMLCLIRSRREALIALAFFVGGQVFLLGSTWLLVLGVSVPWSKNAVSSEQYAIFSTYLDQSIMTAVLAAVCWHLRACVPGRYQTLLSGLVAGLALICVFFVFQGRTGHLVAVSLITLAMLWGMPRRFRAGVMLVPVLLLLALAASSGKVRHGLAEIETGVHAFSEAGDISTSSGTRLNLWHRSLQSIAERPWLGTGAGSWNQAFNQQEARHAPANFVPIAGNPHQEYLLWGVELGVIGIGLLCTVLLALYRDSLGQELPARRALQSVVLALALACLFNCSLYDALIGDFFCVAVALVLALGMYPSQLASPAGERLPV